MRLWSLAILQVLRLSWAQSLSDNQVDNIKARMAESTQKSWEIGTRAQVLLELDTPSYSVFSNNNLPPEDRNPPSSITPVMKIASSVVGNRAESNNNAQGPQLLMQDGSAADPASIGVAVLLANWTNQPGQDYGGAAKDQLDFLLYSTPRAPNGAISHRVAEAQLWSDFVYMAPPFIAYYGVVTNNQSLVQEAYNQIKRYRDVLRDHSTDNLWRHVLLGSTGTDTGHWSTGNAWAAAGMLRVLATIKHSPYVKDMKGQQKDLTNWVREIHDGMYKHLDGTNLFTNYASNPISAAGNFYDAASTALLASTVYRLSNLADVHTHLPHAERCRQTISNGSLISAQGWLSPVVNPYNVGVKGEKSPEAQAFVLAMHAAWRDWVAVGSPGANAAVGKAVCKCLWSAIFATIALLSWL